MAERGKSNLEQTGEEFRAEVIAALSLGEMGHLVSGFPNELLSVLSHPSPQDGLEKQIPNNNPQLDHGAEIFHK